MVLYNQTLLPVGRNPEGIHRNEIWQIGFFHFTEFGKLKFGHHNIDIYSRFQWVTTLTSEKFNSVIPY
jgi:hypothetical protein